MHPDRRFAMSDEDEMRAVVRDVGVVHLFAQTPEGPMVAHVPVVATQSGDFRFHLARSNRIAAHLDGAAVVASAMGANGYVSPDWYAQSHNQVPTWNYVAVEIDGVVRALDRVALIDQIDALSAFHEARLLPKPPWTMAKLDTPVRDRMLGALRCFELRVTAMRGTRKLGQNKRDEDRLAAATGVEAGNAVLARLMRD